MICCLLIRIHVNITQNTIYTFLGFLQSCRFGLLPSRQKMASVENKSFALIGNEPIEVPKAGGFTAFLDSLTGKGRPVTLSGKQDSELYQRCLRLLTEESALLFVSPKVRLYTKTLEGEDKTGNTP